MNKLPDRLPDVNDEPETPSPKSLGWVLLRGFFSIQFWGYGLFWSWNLIFLAFMFLGFAPNLLPEMFDAIRAGLIPFEYLVLGTLLVLIPVFAVLLGATLLRRSPGKLLVLGYGIEGPLMILLLARLFMVRQATAAIIMLYGVALVGVLALLWQLLDRRIDERNLPLSVIRIFGLSLLFLIGVYAAILIAFYAIPVMAELPQIFADTVREFWRAITELSWRTLGMLPFMFFGFILLLYTATLFAVAPIVVPSLYVFHWIRGLKAVAARRSMAFAGVTSGIVILAVAALFSLANQQPQHQAYTLLQSLPATINDAKALLRQQDAIRNGLLNAYLAPVRYISAVGEVGHIQDMYTNSLNMSDDAALNVEHLYETVARPFLYEPMLPAVEVNEANRWQQRALNTEPEKAAELYESFFDVPIVEGERRTIVNAVRDTWSGDQALTAWQAVDDREILLTQQEVDITEHGDWAEVELREVYQNQTSQRQEVVYYFSLPETAVLTGVWLGNSSDRNERSTFHVAPRGAAQQVYREQVRVNMDPALLEQLGPRQYRLRVFPIEPQGWTWQEGRRSELVPGAMVYLWLTYSVFADDGAWPLPQLAEKANVFWDKTSVRKIDGVGVGGTVEDWLPASVPATGPIERVAHQVTFSSGETIVIRPTYTAQLPTLPKDARLAVVLDRSHSMAAESAEVERVLTQLKAFSPDIDVYLTASIYRGEQASLAKLADLVPSNVLYYGGQNAAELLQQYFALNASRRYDALLVVTDGSGFKLGGETVNVSVPDAPVWMIHVGGFPLGYDDATLQAIQASGGGVAATVGEAFTRLAISLAGNSQPAATLRDVVDGYEWLTIPAGGEIPAESNVVVHTPDDAFAALAARRLILSEMYRQRGQITQVETLDALHALAVEQGIVTPYSSMIVLITKGQEERLEKLEGQADRFEREAEGVGETIPNAFQVTGVPEPHEWLLIGLAVVMLAWLAWRRRAGLPFV